MRSIFLFVMLFVITIALSPVSAQTIVKGHVVNERGEAVEYVSIGLQNDSIGGITDARGHFAIEIPKGKESGLVFSHVSYQTATLFHETFGKGGDVTVTLKDKVVELAEVTVGKKSKPKTIARKSITGGSLVLGGYRQTEMVAAAITKWNEPKNAAKDSLNGSVDEVVNKPRDNKECGLTFKTKKDMVLSDILLTVKHSSYKWCVLSFNIYEVNGSQLTNILNKPLYYRVGKPNGRLLLDVRPEETILLKGRKRYLVSVSIVDSNANGVIELQVQMKKGCFYRRSTGRIRKLPISPAIVVKGYEVEK